MVSLANVFVIVLTFQLNVPLQRGVDAWRPFKVYYYNVSAASFSDQIFINASLDDQMRLSVYFKNHVEINPFLNAYVMMDSGNGLYDLEFINRTIDICRLLIDLKYETFLQGIMRNILHASNFPKRCPIGKKLFFVKNLSPNPERYPPVFPDKKYSFAVRLLPKNGIAAKPLITFKIYIEIKNK